MENHFKTNYYMIITSEFDFRIDIQNQLNIAGLPDRHVSSIKKFRPGDKIVFYISKLSTIGGIAEVTGDYFYDKTRVWSDLYDVWPHRVHTKPIFLIKDISEGIKIKDIWDNLNFIKNKHNKWGCYVQGSFKKLSPDDFEVIENAFNARNLKKL